MGLEIKSILLSVTRDSAQVDYELLSSLIGEDTLKAKFTGLVLDLDHSGPRVFLATLGQMYRAASKYGLKDKLREELMAVDSFFSGSKFGELSQRYLSLLIIAQDFPDIATALPEYKVLGDSNPDWTLRTADGKEIYFEVSAISIDKVISDLRAFDGQFPVSKVIASSPKPLYFEIIFPDNPRKYAASDLVKPIIEAAKVGQFPVYIEHSSVPIMVDLLENRHRRSQIISDELSAMGTMKSTRFVGNKLTYTLAVEINLKSLEAKINQKKKSNKLNKIGNSWVCIYTDTEDVATISRDDALIKKLRHRVEKSAWLLGVVVVGIYQAPSEGIWRMDYASVS